MTLQPAPDGADDVQQNRVPASLDFTTPEQRDVQRTLFRVDGEDYYAVRPKGGLLLRMVVDLDMGDDFAQARMIDQFMDMCLEPESGARLRSRLEDDDDPFDVDPHLTDIINALQAAWGKGRTGRSAPSSTRRTRSGRGSTARRR